MIAASISLALVIIPAIAAASPVGRLHSEEPLGTRIFNRVMLRLCETQQQLGSRVRLVDPSRCAPLPPSSASLTIIKTVVNDNGGAATSSAFMIHLHHMAGESMIDVDGSPQMGNVTGTTYTNLAAGSYHVVETGGPSGYTASFSGACDSSGNVMLAAGDVKTCTIVNDDNAPAPGHLVVNKVTQPAGHTRIFDIMATGTGTITGGGTGTTTDAINKHYMVTAGTYAVEETVPTGWTQVSNTCTNVVVDAGETETCTITNRKDPKITVVKMVVNDSGGTATSSNFLIHVHDMSGTTTVDVAGSPQAGSATGTTYTVMPGTYHVAETGGPSGYTMTLSGDCASDGSVTLAAGDEKTCTVTNNDNPVEVTGKLLITEVLYDPGTGQGEEPENEWVEIYNGMNVAVDLSGYMLHDGSGVSLIPNGTMLPSGKYLVASGSTTTASFWSFPSDAVVVVLAEAKIGNGLANTGDRVLLMAPDDSDVDAVSWGSNTSAFDPSVPNAPAGYSITRTSPTNDTNAAADWSADSTPTPGS